MAIFAMYNIFHATKFEHAPENRFLSLIPCPLVSSVTKSNEISYLLNAGSFDVNSVINMNFTVELRCYPLVFLK